MESRAAVFASKNGPEITHLLLIVDQLGHIFSEGGHSATWQ